MEYGAAAVIAVHGVTWERDERLILNDVHWTVRKDEHWALLGCNGSGKTTLLNMITGYIWPMKGHVSVFGHRLRHRRSARVAQAHRLGQFRVQERIHPRSSP